MLPGPMTTQAVINPGPIRVYQGRRVAGDSFMLPWGWVAGGSCNSVDDREHACNAMPT